MNSYSPMGGGSQVDVSKLSPEQLQQLMDLGALDEQGGDIDKQMQQAMALQAPAAQQHTTGAGATFGSLGNIINGMRGGLQQKDLQAQQKDILKQKTDARTLYAKLMQPQAAQAPAAVQAPGGVPQIQAMQGPQQQPPPALAAQSPFSFGGGPYGYTPGGY